MPDRFSFGHVHDEASQDPFWATRGKAIQAYANLEQSLCSLLSTFAGVERDVAGIIFFKIGNARAVETILEKLLKRRHGSTYSVFWNSLVKLVRETTEKRNQIVHWNTVTNAGDKGFSFLELVPANLFELDSNSPSIGAAGFVEFIDKCNFLSRLCNQFAGSLDPLIPPQAQTWRDIFQQPVVYPPPSNHPLFPTPQGPGTQPLPSSGSPPP